MKGKEEALRVMYSPAIKSFVLTGPLIFLGLALGMFWLTSTFPRREVVMVGLFGALGCWFLYLTFIGVRLLRYANVQLAVYSWGIEVRGTNADRDLAWEEIGSVSRKPVSQVMSCRDASGALVFFIDFKIGGYGPLDAALKDQGH